MSYTFRLKPVELLLIVILAFPMFGTFFPIDSYLSAPTLANPLGSPVEPGRTTTITLLLLYAVAAVLLNRRFTKVLPALVSNWPLFALAGWAMTTALWAEVPAFSFNRTGRLLLVVLYGIYLAQNFDGKTITRILCTAIMIGLLASALVTIMAPSLSRVVDARGAYRGAFSHKNVLGSIASFGIIFGFYAYRIKAKSRAFCAILVLSGTILVFLANSVTAFIALLVSGGFVVYLGLLAPAKGKDRALALLAACVIGFGFYVFSSSISSVLEFAGRDASLTGRTDVWRFADNMIDIKPIWGWGHGIWQMPVFQTYVLQELLWPAPHGHNTWIDIRLQLGIPGIVIATYIVVLVARRVITAILFCDDPEYLLWVAIIIFQGLRSTTETMFIDPASNEMIWFTLAFTRLGRLLSRGTMNSVYKRYAPFLGKSQFRPTAMS